MLDSNPSSQDKMTRENKIKNKNKNKNKSF